MLLFLEVKYTTKNMHLYELNFVPLYSKTVMKNN